MKNSRLRYLALVILVAGIIITTYGFQSNCVAEAAVNKSNSANVSRSMSYIDNGLLRVGVKLNWGGAISEIWYNGVNLVDDHDTGRLIQISLYAGGEYYNYSNCMDPNWGWNPVQGGDKYNHGTPTITHYNRGYEVYIKTRPYEWNPDNKGGGPTTPVYSDIIVEQWVTFGHAPNVVRVKYRITSLSGNFRRIAAQESPCVYTNPSLNRFVIYEGSSPWTWGSLSYYNLPVHPQPPLHIRSSEYWAALVDASNIGLGIYSTKHYYAFYGLGFPPGANTCYFRGDRIYSVHSYGVIEDEIYIIVGSIDQIRQRVYEIHAGEKNYLEWNFDNTYNWNEMWYAIKDIDNIKISGGMLTMNSTSIDPFIRLMYDLGINANQYKTMEIRMYVSSGTYGAIYFTTLTDPTFNEQKKVSFGLTPGNFVTYRINLTSSPNWQGIINGFRLDPTNAIAEIKIDYIKFIVSESPEKIPLYRLWSQSLTDHMYTTDAIEKDWATSIGSYSYEKIACYILDRKITNSVPLYYLYHPAGNSFYTTSDSERQSAMNIGYVFIGVLGYVFQTQVSGTTPFYRLYNSNTVDHFYTIDWSEVEHAQSQGYRYEGIGFYVYTSGGPLPEKYTPHILLLLPLLTLSAQLLNLIPKKKNRHSNP